MEIMVILCESFGEVLKHHNNNECVKITLDTERSPKDNARYRKITLDTERSPKDNARYRKITLDTER